MFKSKKSKTVIITGMHRSGTSAFARLLHKNGINMGPARDANFESRLYNFDLSFYLNFLGGTWDLPYGIRRKDNSIYNHASKLFVDKIESRIRLHKKISFNQNVGFKNPISSLLIPELAKVKDSIIINIDRNADDIVASLMRRVPRKNLNFFPGNYGFAMETDDADKMYKLADYYHSAIYNNNDHVSLFVNYNDLVNPEKRTKLSKDISNTIGRNIVIPKNFFQKRSY